MIELTDAEWDVVRAPLQTEFTEAEFQERLRVAKKLCASWSSDPRSGMTDEQRRIYEQYPMWGFYLVDGLPKRVFGIAGIDGRGDAYLETVSAMMMLNNRTMGGTPGHELQRVDRWPQEAIDRLKCGAIIRPEIYLDPLGFRDPLWHYST